MSHTWWGLFVQGFLFGFGFWIADAIVTALGKLLASRGKSAA